jgi:hypothetical protein
METTTQIVALTDTNTLCGLNRGAGNRHHVNRGRPLTLIMVESFLKSSAQGQLAVSDD